MNTGSLKNIKIKIFFLFPLAFILLAAILMLTAGSLEYWQGWLFCTAIFTPALFVAGYFLKRSPEFLQRRMKFREKELKQKTIIKIANTIFFFGILIPGFDFRFSWSTVPIWLVLISDAVILAGYYLIFLAFKENEFAGRTVEVFKGQRVVDTGPYSVVRHPMYAGLIPLFLFIPLALGSFWAVPPFILVSVIIILRILNEEELLRRDLPGYIAYCGKVRFRLIPFVW